MKNKSRGKNDRIKTFLLSKVKGYPFHFMLKALKI